MAQVTMDSSEYEEMKKNARLLEEALKREKDLSSKIEDLNKEKIETLEKAQKQIVRREIRTKKEHVYSEKPIEEIMLNIHEFVRRNTLYGSGYNAMGHLVQDQYLELIYKEEATETDITNDFTVIGLEEAQQEIRKDLEEKLSKEVKKKLEDYDRKIPEFNKIKHDLSKSKSENYALLKNTESLQEEIDSLKDKLQDLETLYSRKRDAIISSLLTLKESSNIFTVKGKIKEAIKILDGSQAK